MPAYPVRLHPLDEGAVMLRFPDVPEAVALGGTLEEALANARPVLEAMLQSYVAAGRAVPRPSPGPADATVSTDLFDADRWRPLFFSGRL